MAKQEVSKKSEGKVSESAHIPDFMKEDRGKGLTNINRDDVALPRIALLQALSPQVSEGSGRPGEFYHLLAEENLGQKLEVIPVIISRSFLLWKPRSDGGGLLARADDGIHWSPANAQFEVKVNGKEVKWATADTVAKSKLDSWGSSDPSDPQSLPAATKLLNVLFYLPEYPELSPSVYSLQRSALKNGKKFVGKLTMSQAPSFGLRYILTSTKVVGPKGEYMAPVFTPDGYVQDEGLYAHLKEMYEHFEKEGIVVQEKGLDDEAEMENSVDDKDGDF